MESQQFKARLTLLKEQHQRLIAQKNEKAALGNGIYDKYKYPVLTRDHAPLFWRYDLNYETNPYLMERMGINCVFNPGAIELGGKIHLIARVEGADRKSFFCSSGK